MENAQDRDKYISNLEQKGILLSLNVSSVSSDLDNPAELKASSLRKELE